MTLCRYFCFTWTLTENHFLAVFQNSQHTRNTNKWLSRFCIQPPNNNFSILVTFIDFILQQWSTSFFLSCNFHNFNIFVPLASTVWRWCGYIETCRSAYIILMICVCCAFVGIDNKLYQMHATCIKVITLFFKLTQFCHFNSLSPPVHTFPYSIRIKCSQLCTVPSTSLRENFQPWHFLQWYWKLAFDSGTKNESWEELIQNCMVDDRTLNFVFLMILSVWATALGSSLLHYLEKHSASFTKLAFLISLFRTLITVFLFHNSVSICVWLKPIYSTFIVVCWQWNFLANATDLFNTELFNCYNQFTNFYIVVYAYYIVLPFLCEWQ